VRLAGQAELALSLRQWYRLVSQPDERDLWNVVTAGYEYAILDGDEREIVAYHWHPHVPDVPFTHLHVGHGAVSRQLLVRAGLTADHNALRPDLAGAHLPTGDVAMTDVVRLVITHFRVGPLRADWAMVLGRQA